MRALLIQHGCEAAREVLPEDMEAQAKTELNKKAHSAVILCLGNKNLREVTGETTAAGVWSKLETLFMTKSLANKLYLKKKLYTISMHAGRKISEHIDEFNKIILDLANIEEIKERSKAKGDDGEGLILRENRSYRDSRQYIPEFEEKKHDIVELLEKEGYTRKNAVGPNQGDKWFQVFREKTCYVCGACEVGVGSGCSEVGAAGMDMVCTQLVAHTTKDVSEYSQYKEDSTASLVSQDDCSGGKSHRVSFGVGRHTTQGVIDYVHSDLCGPSQVESLEESTGRTVKKLRMDNGLEFCNREFEQLCIESGIARHLIDCRNAATSWVANTFWAEATCTAAYLINMSPSRAIEKKTPMKMWSGHPSDYGMLRIFGCVAYPHDKQGKLEPRAVIRPVKQETEHHRILTEIRWHRDRERRTRTKPLRFQDESNMSAYAFAAAEEEDTHEPLTYQELVRAKKILSMEIVRDRSRKIMRFCHNPGKNQWEAVMDYVEIFGVTANVGWCKVQIVQLCGLTCLMTSNYAKDPIKGRGGVYGPYGGCEGSYLANGHSEETKHINVRYHFIKEVLEAKTVKVLKVGTEHNDADALTKVVPGLKLQHCLEFAKCLV
ncbi:retrovirus-related pol polyprotein from transposon TNT 1-94 [Tanacetum coccineum]